MLGQLSLPMNTPVVFPLLALVAATVFNSQLSAADASTDPAFPVTIHVDAAKPMQDAHLARLREERAAIDEAPDREQLVERSSLAIVTKDAADLQHRALPRRPTTECFPGS